MYLIVPITIIVFAVLLMFIYAAIKIVNYKKETEEILSGSDSNTNIDPEKQK